MGKTILGIRREDKNHWERRVPLVPSDVRHLIEVTGAAVVAQPSAIRCFSDQEYKAAGATVAEDLSEADVIVAVKEVPKDLLHAKKTYLYFSHTIKGQSYNMSMLARVLELGCTLIDYEKIANDRGQRLVGFSAHAGLAGMIDTLWTLGQRFKQEGYKTPFEQIRPAHEQTLDEAIAILESVRESIDKDGLPPTLSPVTFGFAGYGMVSTHAQQILDHLQPTQLDPNQWIQRAQSDSLPKAPIIKVVFHEEHMVKPKAEDTSFDLQDYYAHPEKYVSIFDRYVPYLSVLVNAVYWQPKVPRFITKERIKQLFSLGVSPRFKVIGDISCDVEGAVECTVKATTPEDPIYVYDPKEDSIIPGIAGNGPVIMAVDNLPCELPKEASEAFSKNLAPLIEPILEADYSADWENLSLPPEIKQAVITHQGELTPEYRYLKEHLSNEGQ